MKNPLVTICLLSHNNQETIGKTLSSLLAQDYPNFEILVSDNASTDNSLEIIKSFQKQNPKITLRHNIPDIKPGRFYDGCYDNTNGCIKSGLIKGEFACFFHSDDVYEKNIVSKEAEFLEKNPEAGAVFSSGWLIGQDGDIIYNAERACRERYP